MLVLMQCGSRSGEIVDLLPPSARAMLADGRATLPEPAPVVTEQVAARVDRGMPKAKQRVTR